MLRTAARACRRAACAVLRQSWRFLRTYGLVFATSATADVVYDVYVLALAHDLLPVALATGFVIPYCNLFGWVYLIDAKTRGERVAVTTATAMGVVVGTALAMTWFRG
jgi:hypothetical protein